MADSASTTNPSKIDRRTALLGLAAVSLTAPALSYAEATETQHPDAALLVLGDRLKAASACAQLLIIKSQEEKTPEADAAWEAAFDHEHEIVSQIEGIPARTLHGLRVKAQALQWCHGDEPIELHEQQTTDIRLAQQIIRALQTNLLFHTCPHCSQTLRKPVSNQKSRFWMLVRGLPNH